jgi:urease accessory protein
MLRTVRFATILTLLAGPAFAHGGDHGSGFLHPFTGLDHILAMVATGVWAALLATRRPVAAVLLPGTFLAMMAIGAAAGFAGIKVPLAEAGVVASVFLLGSLVLAAVRVPVNLAMVVVGAFALLHGYAHALDAPNADPGSYMLGFLVATALLQMVGLGLGWVAQRLVGDLGLRALGALVVAGGALFLVGH